MRSRHSVSSFWSWRRSPLIRLRNARRRDARWQRRLPRISLLRPELARQPLLLPLHATAMQAAKLRPDNLLRPERQGTRKQADANEKARNHAFLRITAAARVDKRQLLFDTRASLTYVCVPVPLTESRPCPTRPRPLKTANCRAGSPFATVATAPPMRCVFLVESYRTLSAEVHDLSTGGVGLLPGQPPSRRRPGLHRPLRTRYPRRGPRPRRSLHAARRPLPRRL